MHKNCCVFLLLENLGLVLLFQHLVTLVSLHLATYNGPPVPLKNVHTLIVSPCRKKATKKVDKLLISNEMRSWELLTSSFSFVFSGPLPDSFSFIRLFNTADSKQMLDKSLPLTGIWTEVLWYQRRSLYQLSQHNHCPKFSLVLLLNLTYLCSHVDKIPLCWRTIVKEGLFVSSLLMMQLLPLHIFKWAFSGLFFVYFRSFQLLYRRNTADLSGFQTQFARVQEKHADHQYFYIETIYPHWELNLGMSPMNMAVLFQHTCCKFRLFFIFSSKDQ